MLTMKILRIISAGYEQGGAENGVVLTNTLLRKAGHDIKVVSSDVDAQYEHFSDYEFASVPDGGIKKLIWAAFNVDAYKVTKKVLSDFKPDVVLLHTMSQPTASVLFLLNKYPTIQFVHGPEIFTRSLLLWYLGRKDYKNGEYTKSDLTLMGRAHYLYFKYVCGLFYWLGLRNIDLFVALSTYTEDFLKVGGFSPITYVPNGARTLEHGSPLPAQPTLLYAGRLEKFKGVDDLIRAMPAIIKFLPSTKLNIAGDGGYSEELRSLVVQLNLHDSVTFLGHLNKEQIASQYQNSSAFVMPSTWPETFGKVGIEAMSAGRPVIACDVGGVRDWLENGKNGFLVAPHSPDQIATRAIELLRDNTLLEAMGNRARITALKFSIETLSDNIEQLCYNAVNSRTGI